MGWWNVKGTDSVLGDLPLDVLDSALREVVKTYQVEFGRRPTLAEWEALLVGVLGTTELEDLFVDDRVVTRVRIDVDPCRGA